MRHVRDEGWFHRRRGLPNGSVWDTRSTRSPPPRATVDCRREASDAILAGLRNARGVSCLLITKDEVVHAVVASPPKCGCTRCSSCCTPSCFLPSVSFGGRWGWHAILVVQLAATLTFAAYQFTYWSSYGDQHRTHSCREQRSLRDARGPLVRGRWTIPWRCSARRPKRATHG